MDMDSISTLIQDQPALAIGAAVLLVLFLYFALSSSGGNGDSKDSQGHQPSAQQQARSVGGGGKKKKKKKKKGSGGGGSGSGVTAAPVVEAPAEVEPQATSKPKKEKEDPVAAFTPESNGRNEVEEEADVGAEGEGESAGAAKKKKKKRKKKKAAAVAVEPTPDKSPISVKDHPADDEEDSDDEDEAVDAARLLTQRQLAKTGAAGVVAGANGGTAAGEGKKKKKRKKKKKAKQEDEEGTEEVQGDWETVANKAATTAEQLDADAPVESPPVVDDAPQQPHTITLNLNPEDPPVLIGPKGSTIKHLETLTGARFDIDKTSSGAILRITGTENSIAIALEQVKALIDAAEEERRAATAHTITLAPADIKGSDGVKAIIGRGGGTIQSIQEQTGANLSASVEKGEVVITGPTKECVDEAARLCRNAVFGEAQHSVELGSRGMVMVVCGRDFQRIRALQTESGARLDVDRGSTVLKMSGSAEAVRAARAAVEEVMERSRGVTMEIDGSKVGAVYGKAGANIRSIQERTGAFVEVDQPSGKGKANCRIMGEPEAVAEAKTLFQKALDGEVELKKGEVLETVELGAGTPAVIGRGGSKITELERTHGVKINVSSDSGTCRIVGEKGAVAAAKSNIEAIVTPIIEAAKLREEADRLAAQGDSTWGSATTNGNGWVAAEEETGW